MNARLSWAYALVLLTACAAIDPDADAVVVNAERTTQQCVAVIDAALKYEYDHRVALNPNITKLADNIRVAAPPLIRSVRSLTKTYKATKLPEDAAALQSRIQQLESLAQTANGIKEQQS